MLTKLTRQENVSFGLAVLNYYLRFNSKQNLQDANVAAEEIVSELVNILLDYKFKCTSEIKSTYPGIDALDINSRTGLQISHDKTNKKINNTIDKIKNNQVNDHIDTLYFFITSRRQVTYKITSSCPGLSVVSSNILDFDSLANLLSKNENKLARAEDELKKAMPRLYQDGKARYEAMLDTILVARKEMDRGVFHASRVMEDPVEMLDSIKAMRISIQKGGVMNSADPISGAAFREIIKLIRAAEEKVATELNEGFKRYRKKLETPWENAEYGQCIDILMAIRPEIKQQVDIIDNEIERLKSLIGI